MPNNFCATVTTVYGWDKSMKCAYFVNLSTTLNIIDFPFDLDKPSMKSIVISENIFWGMGSGWRSPREATNPSFYLLHMVHCLTYSFTSFHIFLQYKIAGILIHVAFIQEWPLLHCHENEAIFLFLNPLALPTTNFHFLLSYWFNHI